MLARIAALKVTGLIGDPKIAYLVFLELFAELLVHGIGVDDASVFLARLDVLNDDIEVVLAFLVVFLWFWGVGLPFGLLVLHLHGYGVDLRNVFLPQLHFDLHFGFLLG